MGSFDNVTGGVSRLGESSKVGERLQEISFGLQQESNNHGIKRRDSDGTNDKRSDGFEPFVGKEPQDGQLDKLFVNLYGGNYAQKMELNRRRVERALQIAHLDGKVFLSSLSQSRSRSEVQGNELAAKRFLVFGERPKEIEEDPYKRVVSVPEGWRIEINDQKITEELMEERLGGEELQKAFIRRFNTLVKQGIRESVLREKLSSAKDIYFRRKLFWSLAFPVSLGIFEVPFLIINPSFWMPFYVNFNLAMYGFMNFNDQDSMRRFEHMQIRLKDSTPNFKDSTFSLARNTDSVLEYFLPPVEIDKVGRTFAYLAGKGRTLVREVGEEG